MVGEFINRCVYCGSAAKWQGLSLAAFALRMEGGADKVVGGTAVDILVWNGISGWYYYCTVHVKSTSLNVMEGREQPEFIR